MRAIADFATAAIPLLIRMMRVQILYRAQRALGACSRQGGCCSSFIVFFFFCGVWMVSAV